MELLMRLQALQDMLSGRLDLCLVIVDHGCRDITIASGLPEACLQSGNYYQKCSSEIFHIVEGAQKSEKAFFYQCFKGLHCFGLKTGFTTGGKETFLIGGRTKNLEKIEENVKFVSAIFTLPLSGELELNRPFHTQDSSLYLMDPDLRDLSQQELKTLYLIGAGHSNKDIAAKLYISVSTAKTHVSHVLRKIGAANRTEAALFAVKKGLVKGNDTF